MKRIADILAVERIRDLGATQKDAVIEEMCALAASSPEVTDPAAFLRAIRARETAMSTGIGMGLAIPHAKIPSVTDFVMAVGRSLGGIEFDSLDDLPVNIVILIGSSDSQANDFLRLIAKIGGLFNRPGIRERFLAAASPADIHAIISEAD